MATVNGSAAADVEVLTHRGLGLAQCIAQTERGEEFVDAYTALDLHPIDAGRIVLPFDGVYAFTARAREAGVGTAVSEVEL